MRKAGRLRLVILFILAAIIVSPAAFNIGCSKKGKTGVPEGSKPGGVGAQAYVVLEKVLADQPGRLRTTMKIVIPEPGNQDAVKATLNSALESTRKDDPVLKAVIIWAYQKREELNGSNFTVGKLEWSTDGKDFNGGKELAPNPKMDVLGK